MRGSFVSAFLGNALTVSLCVCVLYGCVSVFICTGGRSLEDVLRIAVETVAVSAFIHPTRYYWSGGGLLVRSLADDVVGWGRRVRMMG